MSKLHKKVIFKQLSGHTNKFRSQILYGFRRVHTTKHVPFRLFYLDYVVFMEKTIRQFWVCWCNTYVAF